MDADEHFVGFGSGDWGGVFTNAGGAYGGGKTVGDVFLGHGTSGTDTRWNCKVK